jgi:hypothetical protein
VPQNSEDLKPRATVRALIAALGMIGFLFSALLFPLWGLFPGSDLSGWFLLVAGFALTGVLFPQRVWRMGGVLIAAGCVYAAVKSHEHWTANQLRLEHRAAVHQASLRH